MYCSECELRIADDDVTICPVCQGPLQPEAKNDGMFDTANAAIDKSGSVVSENQSPETLISEVPIDDKFSAYESFDQDGDFNPEKLGLLSSEQKDPATQEEDIRVLADLWENEDVDADLEGVLAEAFSLDETEKGIDADLNIGIDEDLNKEQCVDLAADLDLDFDLDTSAPAEAFAEADVEADVDKYKDLDLDFERGIDVEDKNLDVNESSLSFDDTDEGVDVNYKTDEMIADNIYDDKNIDVEELELNVDSGKDDLDDLDDLKVGHSEVLPTMPPIAASPRNRRPLLLLLLLVVIGAGGACWLYMQSFAAKPKVRVAKQIPASRSVKPVSAPPVKRKIVAEKVTLKEPVSKVVQDASGGQVGTVSVSGSANVKAINEKKAGTLPQVTKPVKAIVIQPSVKGQERLIAQKMEVSDKPAAGLVKKSKTPAAPPISVGEKTSVSVGKRVQDGSKSIFEVKPFAETAPAAAASITEEAKALPYVVHVGSFRSTIRASNQVAMLQEKGFPAYHVEVYLENKGVWQRVFVPGGVTRGEAKDMQQKLAESFPREESLIRKIRK
ncbi:MAG: SPOR domain-containing protein [Deltaproteobacteria bacterium]|nr:SPOR domain-containing protein [Candidatus Tharpella aukensis]